VFLLTFRLCPSQALDTDFASLHELDQIVQEDNSLRYGSGVIGKRNRRLEEQFAGPGKNRKKPKHENAGELISAVSRSEATKRTAYDKERRRVMKPRHKKSQQQDD
jgi:hypothetical protein